jgi:hypothetical protein
MHGLESAELGGLCERAKRWPDCHLQELKGWCVIKSCSIWPLPYRLARLRCDIWYFEPVGVAVQHR